VKSPKGGWAVKKGGSQRASKVFDNKDAATSYAREQSRGRGSELIIHRKDGTIQKTASHGKDPMPPRDRDTNKKR
jgi:hypothetical protein